ncbi:HAD domain-containing protein [Nocardia puris]|uniref:Secreted protein n=1 Tax=Nocardia puris TaxID=208602 RepID=A0A366E200_9NOCA|nr:HAD domain-containing protein [Nocardia puris]RBO96396.1 hypothetical protein DFR74_101411 [Nocardia puris]
MPRLTHRPLLYLDVDGPLIPFGATTRDLPGGYPSFPPEPPASANPLLARLNPALGARLIALDCEPVWATTWRDEANDEVAPRIGLPRLPFVDWPDQDDDELRHRKTRPLVDHAAGRPFVWLDDEITDADRAWVTTHHPAPALLHRVDPRYGLTDADFDALTTWLRTSAR